MDGKVVVITGSFDSRLGYAPNRPIPGGSLSPSEYVMMSCITYYVPELAASLAETARFRAVQGTPKALDRDYHLGRQGACG